MIGCFPRRHPEVVHELNLIDPENGKTTKKFVADLIEAGEYQNVKFNVLDNSRRQKTAIERPLVLIVRSTTPRFTDDLDAALDKIESVISKYPNIILFVFHNENMKDFLQEKAESKGQYSQAKIITMDFCDDSLCQKYILTINKWMAYKRHLKGVNKYAFEELKRTAEEIKNTPKDYKLSIYDNDKSTISRTIIEKLGNFMDGSLQVEKTDDLKFDDLKSDVPQAVISKTGVGILKKVQELGIILICLRDDQGSDAAMNDKRIQRIDIDIKRDEKYFITYRKCAKLMEFVRSFYEKKAWSCSVRTERTKRDRGNQVSKMKKGIDDVDEKEKGSKQTKKDEEEYGENNHSSQPPAADA